MAGLKERLTERRAQKRAARDERRMRRVIDPRMGLGTHDLKNSVDVELYERRAVGREFGPRDYGPCHGRRAEVEDWLARPEA
jgi:hypothetical protein